MIPQIIPFWQSILVLGKTVLPYVGLVLLIVLAILLIILVLYLLYRLARRLPIFFRHLSWRGVTTFTRFFGWLRRGRSASQPAVLARFYGSNGAAVPLHLSFATGKKKKRWATALVSRPKETLFLVFGFEGSGKSTLLAMGGQADANTAKQLSPACDLIWWRMEHGWALEVNQALVSAHDTPKFSHMLRILEQMCPDCPVDGLIVVLTTQQLLLDTKDAHTVHSLAATAASIARQLRAALPVQLVITHSDHLRGFDSLAQLRTLAGQRQAMLGLRLPAASLGALRQPTAELLREAVLGQVLLAFSMQPSSSDNFPLRQALELPTEINRLRDRLQQFESQLSIDSAATSQPWLQSVFLIGFASDIGSVNLGELVFSGQVLRQQLFVKSIILPLSSAYKEQLQRQTIRSAVLTFVVIASCLGLLLWSSVTWKRMDQNIVTVERLLQDIGPELNVAKNSYVALAGSLGTTSLEKLIHTMIELDECTFTYTLVPSSWFSELRTDALKGVGEIISRTLIRSRSERLAADIPNASEAMLVPISGISAQRIEELPAYQDLLAFLETRELVGMSMDSAQRLNKQISYADFLRFLGNKPEQIKLSGIDWNEVMPVAVTQRFRVEALKSPAVDAALRHIIDSYWDRLLREALDQHPMVQLSNDIQGGLLNAASDMFGVQEAQQLDSDLKKLKREAELPSSRRIFGSKNEALVFFAKAQLRLGVSSVVPSGQIIDLTALLEKRFDNLRSMMLQKEAEGVGLLFAADAREGTLQLSPGIKRFGSAYGSYMSQPFMRPVGQLQVLAVGNGQYLEWNLSEVQPARILAEAYRDYLAGGAQVFDASLKSNLMRLARSNYLRQTDSLFSNSVHLREEAQVRIQTEAKVRNNAGNTGLRQLASRVANLAAVGKLYRQLQPTDNATSILSAVNDQLTRESSRLLEQFEVELFREDPYGSLIADVASWLRDAPDEKMLSSSFNGNAKERLASSREYVRMQYVAAALPLLEYLMAESSKVAPSDTVLRWSRLRETIEGYEKGNASNGIYEFERYLLALTKLRGANDCIGFMDERQLPVQRGDYFSQKLVHLDEAVVSACEQRITQNQRRNYESFANWFNSNIADRPPFSSSGWYPGHPALAIPVFERMLSRYSEFRKPLQGYMKNRDSWPADVGLFIARMDQIADYFIAQQRTTKPASVNTGGASKLSARVDEVRSDMPFRARLEFRSGRMYEAGADQIMEWNIRSGGRRYSSRGDDLFQWKIGEPIEVQFRWAVNSPVSPVATVGKNNNYSVSERSASFRYGGDWALFELLEKHKFSAIDTDGGVALSFRISTLGPNGREDAKTFISMLPSDSGNALLPNFPAQAPLFPRNWSNGS